MAIADLYKVDYHEGAVAPAQGASGAAGGGANPPASDPAMPAEAPGRHLEERHEEFVSRGYRDGPEPTIGLGGGLMTDTPSRDRESDEVAEIMGSRPIDRLNADVLKALDDPAIRADDARLFDTCDKYLDLIGLPSHHGNTLNSKGGNAEYASALALADDVKRMIREGYRSVLDPEYVKTMDELDALEPGDRDGMAKALGVATDRDENAGAVGGAVITRKARRADADIDADIEGALNRLYAKNYKALYSFYRKFLDERGERVLRASIRHGKGLPLSAVHEYELIRTTDPKQGEALARLIDGAAVDVPDRMADLLAGGRDKVRGFFEGGFRGLRRFNQIGAPELQAKQEKEDYLRYLNSLTSYAEATPADREKIARMCRAAHEAEGLLSPEARKLERENTLALRRATEHQPYTGYSIFDRSWMEALQMPIYMLEVASAPGAAYNVFAHFDNVRDSIVERGGDPYEAEVTRLMLAGIWAGVERFMPEGFFGKSFTNLEKKAMVDRARQLGAAAVGAAKRKIRAGTLKEFTAKQITETIFEEAPQDALEAIETDIGLGKDGLTMFRDAVGAYVKSAVESQGAILPWSAVGTARAHHRVHRKMLDSEDVRSFYVSVSRMNNQVRGEVIHDTANAQTPERKAKRELAKAKRVGRYVNRALEIWEKHETKGDAAAEIESALGLSPDAVNSLAEVFTMRDRILKDAEGNADRTTAYRDALIAHGLDPNLAVLMAGNDAGRHGARYAAGSDENYDPVRHFQRLLPGAKVETVALAGDDPGAAPAAGARPTHGVKVTIPVMGADGQTHDMSFTAVERVPETVDIHTPAFAASVENATRVRRSSSAATWRSRVSHPARTSRTSTRPATGASSS